MKKNKIPVIVGPHKYNVFYILGTTLKALTDDGQKELGEQLVVRACKECNSIEEIMEMCAEHVKFKK